MKQTYEDAREDDARALNKTNAARDARAADDDAARDARAADPPDACDSAACAPSPEADAAATAAPPAATAVPGLTRRNLLLGVGGAAVLVALGGAGVAWGASEDLMHPPGGGDDDHFYAACIRCDRCGNICPTHAIGVAKLESGLLSVRTPKMEFRHGYCDACDGDYRCIAACPTGALRSFDPSTDKIGTAVIDEDKCETYGVSASCGRVCIEACPAEALLEDEVGRVYVDEDACWGCGACEYVCPTNAYRTYDGSTLRGVNVVAWKGGA